MFHPKIKKSRFRVAGDQQLRRLGKIRCKKGEPMVFRFVAELVDRFDPKMMPASLA
jgi:hypothetical protein